MYKYELFHFIRKNRKISLDDLSKKLGVSKSYLSLIEKGSRKLSYDLAVRIALCMEMTPDDLFFDDHKIRRKYKVDKLDNFEY